MSQNKEETRSEREPERSRASQLKILRETRKVIQKGGNGIEAMRTRPGPSLDNAGQGVYIGCAKEVFTMGNASS